MTRQAYRQTLDNITRDHNREIVELYNLECLKSNFSDEKLQSNNVKLFFASIGFVFVWLTIPSQFFTVAITLLILCICVLNLFQTVKAYFARKRNHLPLDRTFNMKGLIYTSVVVISFITSLIFLFFYLGDMSELNLWVISTSLIIVSSYFLWQLTKHIFIANSENMRVKADTFKKDRRLEKNKWRKRSKSSFKNWCINHLADWKKELSKDWVLYLMFVPVFIWMILFLYKPKLGLVIAFQDYHPFLGIAKSTWVGFDHFLKFITHAKFKEVMINTLVLNFYGIVFIFPTSIIFALMLNELRNLKSKKFFQTVSFIPYFISTVVVVGIFVNFFRYQGIINNITTWLGMERTYFLLDPLWSMAVYFAVGLYQNTGYSALIYIAALSGIDPNLYEAASIDGASKLQKIWNVTIPAITPTIIIMLILRIGRILNVGHERLYLLRNTQNAESLEVLSTFVLSLTIDSPVPQYSYATAVGLFNTVVSIIMVTMANKIAKKTGNSLW
ncbi:ABC transporter permease [Vallitalea okinawensis]|uniref:ABC transporter permease n=1 Tax=Vallitalea okinawensis TaxID=2078660 RepID=UPI000CFCA595|nr:ABC transporter permease subunit [Vallitalea okinawensis]